MKRTLVKSAPELWELADDLARMEAWMAGVEAKLEALREVGRGEGNLLHPIREALAADASIGVVCGAMRDVFGEYRGGAFF